MWRCLLLLTLLPLACGPTSGPLLQVASPTQPAAVVQPGAVAPGAVSVLPAALPAGLVQVLPATLPVGLVQALAKITADLDAAINLNASLKAQLAEQARDISGVKAELQQATSQQAHQQAALDAANAKIEQLTQNNWNINLAGSAWPLLAGLAILGAVVGLVVYYRSQAGRNLSLAGFMAHEDPSQPAVTLEKAASMGILKQVESIMPTKLVVRKAKKTK